MSANSRLTIAVHALCWLELARREGRPSLTSEQVADSLRSDPALVRRTLAPLRDHGLLAVGRGPGSGWALARPAARITVAEVHAALDDGSAFALHPHDPKPTCPVGHGIRPVLAELYAAVDDAVAAVLARRTVADVLDELIRDHPLPADR